MATNGKRKGKEGELELAHKLEEYGYKTKRSVQYNGKDGQADVIGLPHIHIECTWKFARQIFAGQAKTAGIIHFFKHIL